VVSRVSSVVSRESCVECREPYIIKKSFKK
jgi:hypothetical protein